MGNHADKAAVSAKIEPFMRMHG